MGRSVLLSTSDVVCVSPGHTHKPSVVVLPTVVDVEDDPGVELLVEGQIQAVVVVDMEAEVDVVDISELVTACLFPLKDLGAVIIWDLFTVYRSCLPSEDISKSCEISLEDILEISPFCETSSKDISKISPCCEISLEDISKGCAGNCDDILLFEEAVLKDARNRVMIKI